jgi:hypothetical protein
MYLRRESETVMSKCVNEHNRDVFAHLRRFPKWVAGSDNFLWADDTLRLPRKYGCCWGCGVVT